MVPNFCKNSFLGGKSRINGLLELSKSCVSFAKKNKKITDFNQLAPNMLSALAGLILHSCGF